MTGEDRRRRSARAPARPAARGAAGGTPAAGRRCSPPVRAPISTSGWPSSRRSSSPPAYPLAPATATVFLLMPHDYTYFRMTMKLGCRLSAPGPSVRPMEPLPFPAYLDHIRTESARFREVLADCDPAARVPACPDWDAADLLWHLTTVQAFWAKVVSTRPEPADEADEGRLDRPGDVRRAAGGLRRALRRAGRRPGSGGSRRGGLALVDRPHRRRELPPPGARGADPPPGRRGDGRPGHRPRPDAGRRRRPRGAHRHVRRLPALGHDHPVRPRPRDPGQRHRRRPAHRPGALHRHRPRRRQDLRRAGHRAARRRLRRRAAGDDHGHRRRPGHLAVAPRPGPRASRPSTATRPRWTS